MYIDESLMGKRLGEEVKKLLSQAKLPAWQSVEIIGREVIASNKKIGDASEEVIPFVSEKLIHSGLTAGISEFTGTSPYPVSRVGLKSEVAAWRRSLLED